MNSDQDVRIALCPLRALAERSGAAIVFIRHMNKGAGSAMLRGSGSIGIGGAMRSLLLCAETDDENTEVAVVKSSAGRKPPGAIRYGVQSWTDDAYHSRYQLDYHTVVARDADALAQPRKAPKAEGPPAETPVTPGPPKAPSDEFIF